MVAVRVRGLCSVSLIYYLWNCDCSNHLLFNILVLDEANTEVKELFLP